MANFSSADVGFWIVGGYNILGYTTKVDVGHSMKTEDITCLGDTTEENAGIGLQEFTVDMEAFYDTAAGATDDTMEARIGVNSVATLALEGNTNGYPFIGMEGPLLFKVNRKISMSALIKMDTSFKGSGRQEKGLIMQPLGVVASTTAEPTNTKIDNAAGTTAGGVGWIQCTNFAGATSLTVKIRHSTDDITYVDLITFTNITASIGSYERIAVAGTVNRYVRMKYTFNTPTAQTATIFVGFTRY